jgi:hypothetical protein
MKKLTQLGAILITIGLSLVIVNLMRNASTFPMTASTSVPSQKQSSQAFFFRPRDVDIQISTSSPLTILIRDPSNATVLNAENVTNAAYTLHLEKRGNYNISAYNPTNSTITLNVHLTFYNLENDITQASVVLIAAGIVIIIAQKVLDTRLRRKESSA